MDPGKDKAPSEPAIDGTTSKDAVASAAAASSRTIVLQSDVHHAPGSVVAAAASDDAAIGTRDLRLAAALGSHVGNTVEQMGGGADATTGALDYEDYYSQSARFFSHSISSSWTAGPIATARSWLATTPSARAPGFTGAESSAGALRHADPQPRPMPPPPPQASAMRPVPAADAQGIVMGVDGVAAKRGEVMVVVATQKPGTHRTKRCRYWDQHGECRRGDECWFAHGEAELQPVQPHPLHKTKACSYVSAGAVCPFGDGCHFLH